MSLLPTLALAVSLIGQSGSTTPLKLKAGDVVTIVAPGNYGGEFTLMNDGSIYGRGFGKIQLAGLTVLDSERAVRSALRKFVKEQSVFFTLKTQRPDFVYLLGQANAPGQSSGLGPTPWQPDMTLRQLISSVSLGSDTDQMEVSLLRDGRLVNKATVQEALLNQDIKLSPNDVVSIMPMQTIRVWVSGAVKNPGEIKIRSGSDLSRTIAAAGGLNLKGDESGENILDEAQILIRRGPNVTKYPARDIAQLAKVAIEAGDDVSVVFAQGTRITVAGEVAKPGELILKGDALLAKAVAMAGGPTAQGTLSHVRVVRQGETLTVDLSPTTQGFALQANDLVVIEKNQRSYYVLGEVAKPGRFLMEDNRSYRVSDAVAQAEGLSQKGTYRRAYLARAGAGGKTVIRQFNLDEFLKDGKLESNPILEPGDCVLFGQSNGLSFGAVNQILSSFLIINSLVGRN